MKVCEVCPRRQKILGTALLTSQRSGTPLVMQVRISNTLKNKQNVGKISKTSMKFDSRVTWANLLTRTCLFTQDYAVVTFHI